MSHTVNVSSHSVLEMIFARSKHFTSLLNSRFDNVLVKIAPDLNQPLFQFINAVDVCIW